MDAPTAPDSYEIEGRTVTMPVEVRDASSGFATFLVRTRGVRALLPPGGVEPVRVLPGRTLMSIGLVDYRDNDLGDYHEVAVLFFVQPTDDAPSGLLSTLRGLRDGSVGTWIWQLPVDQTFTMHAGAGIWGFPKWLADIHVAGEDPAWDDGAPSDPTRWRGRLSLDGQHVLTLDVPRGGRREMPPATTATYTVIDGAWHRTTMTQQAREIGYRLGGGSVELGHHPIARTLRGLGLPKRPVATMWMDGMRATFGPPTPLG